MKRILPLTLAILVSACATPQVSRQTTGPADSGPVEVGLIAINDFHGALEPPKAAVSTPDGEGGTLRRGLARLGRG